MPNIDLKAKLGPLPVWAWGAIVAALFLAWYFLYRGNSAGANDESSTNLDASGYQTSGIKGGSATPPLDIPANNLSWLTTSSRLVATALSVSPTEVYAALQKFLYGEPLTAKERSWVDEAINRNMSPPEGTQGISGNVSNIVNPPAIVPVPVTPTPSPAPSPQPAPKSAPPTAVPPPTSAAPAPSAPKPAPTRAPIAKAPAPKPAPTRAPIGKTVNPVKATINRVRGVFGV